MASESSHPVQAIAPNEAGRPRHNVRASGFVATGRKRVLSALLAVGAGYPRGTGRTCRQVGVSVPKRHAWLPCSWRTTGLESTQQGRCEHET